jgi:CrcB protein
MSSVVVAVAAGSALGGVARLLLSQSVQARWSTPFPAGTLAVNVLGCLALGFIVQLATSTAGFSPLTRTFLTVGFCGGFTTFSAFAGETLFTAEAGAFRRATIYVGSSLVFGIAGVWLGAAMARGVLMLLKRGT